MLHISHSNQHGAAYHQKGPFSTYIVRNKGILTPKHKAVVETLNSPFKLLQSGTPLGSCIVPIFPAAPGWGAPGSDYGFFPWPSGTLQWLTKLYCKKCGLTANYTFDIVSPQRNFNDPHSGCLLCNKYYSYYDLAIRISLSVKPTLN